MQKWLFAFQKAVALALSQFISANSPGQNDSFLSNDSSFEEVSFDKGYTSVDNTSLHSIPEYPCPPHRPYSDTNMLR